MRRRRRIASGRSRASRSPVRVPRRRAASGPRSVTTRKNSSLVTVAGAERRASIAASTSPCATVKPAPGAGTPPPVAFSCFAPAFVFTTGSTRSSGSIAPPLACHVANRDAWPANVRISAGFPEAGRRLRLGRVALRGDGDQGSRRSDSGRARRSRGRTTSPSVRTLNARRRRRFSPSCDQRPHPSSLRCPSRAAGSSSPPLCAGPAGGALSDAPVEEQCVHCHLAEPLAARSMSAARAAGYGRVRTTLRRGGGSARRHSSHQAIHPSEPRQLTIRECARMQTVPDSYEFPSPPP